VNYGKKMILLRQVIGEELRRRRTEQSRTLRDVSRDAQVSLGYLSELERGQKEASSELLAAVCSALDTPLSELLAGVSAEISKREEFIADRNSVAIA
jgi:transcriptional regulator with XRE-family HTH domain